MRRAPLFAILAIGGAALISGCGPAHPASTGGGAPAASGSAAAPRASGGTPASVPSAAAQSSAAPPGNAAAATCHGAGHAAHAGPVVIRNSDNYQRLCVRRGTTVLVYLMGTATSRWGAIRASSRVLRPLGSGHLSLMRGVTGASFLAVRPGGATLTSIREVCGPSATPGNAAADSGTLECGAILGFQVTVTVT
jgi:hypothetical protein